MKPALKVIALALSLTFVVGLSAPAAMAWPWDTHPGDACKPAGSLKTISHSPYRCDRNFKKKLVWLPNPGITNVTKSLALVAAGCNSGWVDLTDSNVTFDLGVLGWDGLAAQYARSIRWYAQASDNDSPPDKILRTEEAIGIYVGQVFTVAATLDSRWSRLLALWNESITSLHKTFDSPGITTFGDALSRGIAPFAPKIRSLCNLAHEEIKSKVAVEQKTIYGWVSRYGAGLFPDSPTG